MMMSQREPIRIAVFASGRGSGFEAIARAVSEGRLAAEIACVLSDQPDAAVLEKARVRGIPALGVPAPQEPANRRLVHEEAILRALKPYAPRFIVLAGYMRILSPRVIAAFDSGRGYARIVNIHPSLLPAFPGVGGYAQAYRYGAKLAGVTVHLVDEGLDSGPICAQRAFEIDTCRSSAEVEAKGLAIEHELYPRTLEWVLPERFSVETLNEERLMEQKARRLCVRPN